MKFDKLYYDGTVLHGPSCPATKEAWKLAEEPNDNGRGCGPAQVATAIYRENYDRIFGTKPDVGQA